MKIEREAREVQTSVAETGQFKINTNAHMFNMLSSSVYSDKIMAVIRETTCNARDAHTAAGYEDKPYKVHLPTILEPYYSVVDNGIGLSHEDVMHLYTTYGESLKNKTNQMIGGMGIGSKAPFAYTDQFTVESRFEEECRVYSCYVGDDGAPLISLLVTTDTEEHNGLTITVPVKSEDITEFTTKACALFEEYTPHPDTNIRLNYEDKEILVGVDGEFTVENHKNYIRGCLYVIQGQIKYPIDLEKMGHTDKDVDSLLRYCSIKLWVGIGEVDVAASREGLQYTPRTIKTLDYKLQSMYKRFTQEMQKEIDKEDSLYLASVKASSFKRIDRILIKALKYKGKDLIERVQLHVEGLGCTYVDALGDKPHNKALRPKQSYVSNTLYVTNRAPLFFFSEKKNKGANRKIRIAVGDKRVDIYIYSGDRPTFMDFIKENGDIPFIEVKDLPDPPKEPRKQRTSVLLKRFTGLYSGWIDIDHTIEDGGVYIKLRNSEIDHGSMTNNSVDAIHKFIKNTLGKDLTVYGVPATHHKRLDRNSKVWVSLEDYYESLLKRERGKLRNHDKIKRFLTLYKLFSTLGIMGKIHSLYNRENIKYKYNILNRTMKCYKEYKVLSSKYSKDYNSLYRLFRSSEDEQFIDKITEEWNIFEEEHPILNRALDYFSQSAYTLMKDDLKLILT